jgi:endonuclease YncB( thermonuclease family)
MNRRPVAKTSWFTVALLIAAAAVWVLDQRKPPENSGKPAARHVEKPAAEATPGKPEHTGGFEVHHHCTLAEARHNDGDSFMVRLPDGRKEEFRLYFVDTPESAFKRYSGGETNHERIRQQAADLGGITPEQAVETGKKAKSFTLGLLGGAPFTLHTRWDSPFHDGRYHAFVQVTWDKRTRWLHELLIERGLARIKTKGSDLPDGTPMARHREKLRESEKAARRAAIGVWGL